jgi:hypothetical protein
VHFVGFVLPLLKMNGPKNKMDGPKNKIRLAVGVSVSLVRLFTKCWRVIRRHEISLGVDPDFDLRPIYIPAKVDLNRRDMNKKYSHHKEESSAIDSSQPKGFKPTMSERGLRSGVN